MPNILRGIRRDEKEGTDAKLCSKGKVYVTKRCGVTTLKVSTVSNRGVGEGSWVVCSCEGLNEGRYQLVIRGSE